MHTTIKENRLEELTWRNIHIIFKVFRLHNKTFSVTLKTNETIV
jgi:hypothetical protein